MPPLLKGEFMSKVLGTASGIVILIGIGICVLGIAVAGMAGMSKEREMPEEQKKATIKEFNFKKGLLLATLSGVMSACFSYGLTAGDPIKKISLEHGTGTLWQGLPVLVVVLLGGVHDQLYLVRAAQRVQQDRLPVFQPNAARPAWGQRRACVAAPAPAHGQIRS